jgi:hypothetical protein
VGLDDDAAEVEAEVAAAAGAGGALGDPEAGLNTEVRSAWSGPDRCCRPTGQLPASLAALITTGRGAGRSAQRCR